MSRIIGIATPATESAAAFLVDGRLVAAMEEAKIARRVRRHALPWESIDACLRTARCEARDVDIVAIARPVPSALAATLNLNLRERFPNARMVLVGPSPCACRVGLLRFALRGSDRADAGSRRRHSLRCAVARIGCGTRSGERVLLPRFAGGSLYPRYRAAGVRTGCGRA